MTSVVKSNPHGPLQEERLIAFERRIGAALPDDYRAFLLEHNGAVLSPSAFVRHGETEPYARLTDETFGFHESGDSKLDESYENCLDYFPASLVAFAGDVGGDLFLIGTQGKQRGKVYYWDHNRPYCGDDEPSFENVELLLVADSFTQFLSSLVPDE